MAVLWLLSRESYHTRHTEWGDGGGLASGPQHLKPIRELWNIPQGSSTLARGHRKGPRREGRSDSDADKNTQQGETLKLEADMESGTSKWSIYKMVVLFVLLLLGKHVASTKSLTEIYSVVQEAIMTFLHPDLQGFCLHKIALWLKHLSLASHAKLLSTFYQMVCHLDLKQ